jgi:hypothetical protein
MALPRMLPVSISKVGDPVEVTREKWYNFRTGFRTKAYLETPYGNALVEEYNKTVFARYWRRCV